MKQPRSKDYDVRAAVVRRLLEGGVARRDIRHELTLDTSSADGRADMVVLRDTSIIGVELKSGSDTLERATQQLKAMRRSFDRCGFIVDARLHVRRDEPLPNGGTHHYDSLRGLPYDGTFLFRAGVICRTHESDEYSAFVGDLLSGWHYGLSIDTAPVAMACLLWAAELTPLTNSKTRIAALRHIRDNVPLKEVRRHVIDRLRQRELNRWEVAFWQRYDAEPVAPAEAAA